MGASPAVTVAVVSWNTRELLKRCLRSLAPEAEAGTAEVWVVDNASSDGSAELVSGSFPWVRLEACERNLGFGSAVNFVAAHTRTPWIAPANADVALQPGALDALIAAGARDPSAGAIAPRLLLADGSTQHSVHPFPTLPLTAAFNCGIASAIPGLGNRLCLEGHWDPERPRLVPWALGAFLLVRREAWDAVGGFDEGQWMYAEDLDLGWRLRRTGWPTRYEPSARVQHESAAATSQAFGPEVMERWMASTYAWLLRRRGPTRTWLTAAINVAGAGTRWLGSSALARVAPSRRGRRVEANRRWASLHRVGLRPGRLSRHG